jgi:hypothetical protein
MRFHIEEIKKIKAPLLALIYYTTVKETGGSL